MVKDVSDRGDTQTPTMGSGTQATSPARAMPGTPSTCVYATGHSKESKLQNPPGVATPWGKHHLRESCQVHAHVCLTCTEKTCLYANLKALTLYSLYFLNNKNAIKIKEKLVSISDFLFTLKIQ